LRLCAEQQAKATLRERANLMKLAHDAIFLRDVNGTARNRGAEELCRVARGVRRLRSAS